MWIRAGAGGELGAFGLLFEPSKVRVARRRHGPSRRFRPYVLSDNRRMLGLITRFADVRERKTEQGVTELLFTRGAEPTPATR